MGPLYPLGFRFRYVTISVDNGIDGSYEFVSFGPETLRWLNLGELIAQKKVQIGDH